MAIDNHSKWNNETMDWIHYSDRSEINYKLQIHSLTDHFLNNSKLINITILDINKTYHKNHINIHQDKIINLDIYYQVDNFSQTICQHNEKNDVLQIF